MEVRKNSVATHIRRAIQEDEPMVLALIRRFPEELNQEHLPKIDCFFVAVNYRLIVGCCALEVYSPRLAEVRSLALNPDFSKLGIASKLVNACSDRARELGILEILATTTKAVEFFEGQGFAPHRGARVALWKKLR